MADEIDLANDLIDNEVSRALHRMRQENTIKQNQASEFCVECGDTIPSGRQKLGFVLCVPCAEESERKKSLFAG